MMYPWGVSSGSRRGCRCPYEIKKKHDFGALLTAYLEVSYASPSHWMSVV